MIGRDAVGVPVDMPQERRNVEVLFGKAGLAMCETYAAFDHPDAFYASAYESWLDVFVCDGGADDAFLSVAFDWIDKMQTFLRDHGGITDDDKRQFGIVVFCAVFLRYGKVAASSMAYGRQDIVVECVRVHECHHRSTQRMARAMSSDPEDRRMYVDDR